MGLNVRTTRVDSSVTVRSSVDLDELDRDRPHVFFALVIGFLQAQERVIRLLVDACEITEPILVEQRIPAFSKTVRHLHERFHATFPEEMARAAARFGASS